TFPAQRGADPEEIVDRLGGLGAAMVELAPVAPDVFGATGNSAIPPVYTYWGQFIDHDITANTDRDENGTVFDIRRPDLQPLDPSVVVNELRNLRQPSLNLDSVYGDGPTLPDGPVTRAENLYDGIRLKVGTLSETDVDGNDVGGLRIPPDPEDLERDLPRVGSGDDKGKAIIGDDRNDENLVVAQFHVGFLRFHNAVVEWLPDNEGLVGDAETFARARQLVRWHYQWLVVHDYLRTVTRAGTVDKVLTGGNVFFTPDPDAVYMPLEFSVAAYRFGHSMVRGVYDWNANFGRGAEILPATPFRLLFAFTGNASPQFLGRTETLPRTWPADWSRLVDKGSSIPDRFARKIDTRLALPLTTMLNMGNDEPDPGIKELLKMLAARNLLRGHLLALPSGQAVAERLGVTPLSAEELQQNNTQPLNDALAAGDFLTHTPLWFYVLKESEVRENGTTLGEVGSRIVCETIIGQLRADDESYLRQPGGWDPGAGVRLPSGEPIVTISDFLRFAGTL
ncbi:MAG: heme peroxidase family protein, partial [Pseudonocardia sp.]|nr:heme peroxidase family protein [Pseudonocardia sp.]